jgi:hypothetical protein
MKWVFFVRENFRVSHEIDGMKIKKRLNLDEETIKVLELMRENTRSIICEKIVRKMGYGRYLIYVFLNKYIMENDLINTIWLSEKRRRLM